MNDFEWVRAEESLPVDEHTVFVCLDVGLVPGKSFDVARAHRWRGQWILASDWPTVLTVTHWMHLPGDKKKGKR